MTTDPVGPTIQWRTLSMECADADAMATFYTSLLGWKVNDRGDIDPSAVGLDGCGFATPAGESP